MKVIQVTVEQKDKFEEAMRDDNRKLAYRIKIDDKVVLLNQLKSQMVITTDGGFEEYHVGYALTSSLEFYTKKEFEMTSSSYVDIEVGLEVENGGNYEIVYLPFQRFYLYDSEIKGMERKVKCYDYMYKLASKGYFPSAKHQTTAAVCQDMSQQLGIEFKGVQNVAIYSEELEGRTYKEILDYLASAMGCNVRIARDNKIEFFGLTTTHLTFTPREYKTPTLNESTYQVTCLEVHYGEKKTGENGEVLDEGYYRVGEYTTKAGLLTLSNPLLKNQREVALRVLNKLEELRYTRFETSISLADYRLEIGDMVSFQMGESKVTVPLLYTQYTLVYDNVILSLKSPTKSQEKKEYSFQGTLTQKVNAVYTDLIQVKTLVAEKVSVERLEAEFAKIEKLYVKEAEIDQLIAGSIAVQDLQANIANLNVLVAGKADISELNAAVANINILNADLADIKHLVSGHLSAENMQVGGITFDRIQGNTVVIVDAMIQSVNANKIKAGQIDTTLVNVTSSSGNLVIQDNTIQIRDANRVRVQIGKDASNDYSMSVWDSSGKLMFDARGLKADAIKDSIIRNDMISTNANIDGSKLNINSVVSSINQGSSLLKASKVQMDGVAQTLEVAFNVLRTQADGTKSQTESNTTAINVAQGKINTLIQDTTITKDGQTVKLKDEYSKLEQTVGSLSSTIGKQQTTLDDHTGKMTAFNSEMVSLKQNLNGLSASVSTAETTIQSHTQQLAQKADLETVNEKIDAIPFVGRNLFLNSDFSSQESWAGLPTISKDGTINYIRSSSTFITSQKVDVIEGEEYVVSALVRAVTTTPTNFSIKFNVGNYNSTNIDITSTDWVRVSVTITAKSTIKEQIYLCNRGNAGIDIAFVKIEKGTKDTDWSLAPEDIQASIDAKANSSDVYVKTEVYTKAQTDSAIDVTKNAITQSVASTYETKTESTTKYDTATAIAKSMNEGKVLYTDIAFRTGRNSVVMYNNTGNGNVVVERITKPTDCPTTSTHCIRITHKGTASPNLGGFHQNIQSRANAVFIQKFVAMLPSGYTLNTASNSMGDGYSDKWLTSNKGTGKWETYIRRVICGSTGTFFNGGHVHVSGATPTISAPLVWYLASCTCIDITDTDERVTDLTSRISKAEQKITDSAIIQTVSQTINQAKTEAIQSANSNTANQLKNYSTTLQMNSAIQQKADSITSDVFKIETSLAVDNLLSNGNFTNELNNWQYRDHGSSVNYTLTANTDWTMTGKTALLITQSNHPQGYDSGFTQEIDVKPNTDYTFTGYIASHRAEGMAVVKDDAGNWLVFDKTDADYDQYTGGPEVSRWKKIRLVYWSGNRTKLQLHLAMGKSNNNGHVWFHDFMVTEGNTDLCWKPSQKETRTQIAQLDNRISSTVTSVETIDGKVNKAQSQIDQHAHQIATKVNANDFSSLIQQNGHSIMWAINSSRGSNGIGLDSGGLYGYNNNITTLRLTEGKFHAYNSWNGNHMGYFGTNGDDLRACLYDTNTFSVYSNDTALLFRARYERDANYGNATLDMCGGINFIHKPGQDVGINQLLLGNDDRSDRYGFHNMSIRCWNSFGFQDNYGYTNMFFDSRRGRVIMKGALYQNTQTPPATFSMNFDGEDEIYSSGYERSQAIDSVMNLKTGVYVDNDGECCSAIYGGYSELITTEYQDEYGKITTHLNHEALNASLVVTCQEQQKLIKALQKELNEIKEYLNVA